MTKNQARPVTHSTDVKSDYLVNAEMVVEGNCNMVGDGIINNVPKPSMLERLTELEQQRRERHKAERNDDTRERHKADYLDSREGR